MRDHACKIIAVILAFAIGVTLKNTKKALFGEKRCPLAFNAAGNPLSPEQRRTPQLAVKPNMPADSFVHKDYPCRPRARGVDFL